MEVSPLTPELLGRYDALLEQIRGFDRVVVAFSGGVDSTLVAKAAHDALGARALALTARSASLMRLELQEAVELAEQIGIAHEVVDTGELDKPGYAQNDRSRCYFCKDELFDAAQLIAERFEEAIILDGFNHDDLADFRPGHKAAQEHGVKHPLAAQQLTKAEVRALSKHLGLPTWKKPQLACLSSRLPYGMEVTEARLGKVEHVESAMRALGFFDLRARLVRENEEMVRLEVGEQELSQVILPDIRSRIIQAAHEAGFRFVTLDLEGFRSGRLNENAPLVQLGRRPQKGSDRRPA